MSDTVKIIIEIPRNEYEYTCERTLSDRTFWDDAIRKGVPLDFQFVFRNYCNHCKCYMPFEESEE